MILRAVSHPPETLEDLAQELNLDIGCILAIRQTQYLQGWPLCSSPVAYTLLGSMFNPHLIITASSTCYVSPLKSFRSFCHLLRIIQSSSTILAMLRR
ncbi:hypothetical protein PAXRUDRAFT_374772 [Paxillus rubicundulus Ve08.2h10]|uniref:Uncharacterized protein n=1 Tax=Paxillus rubicundulus Ve08.2h10 TaxID=930991 RepID=A0A0D0DRE8_9AGAM|nr:hypothetical protein PAXRUDRAFT_374772 [Paxillus rubicundulus Ve08.2h10]